MSGRSFLRHALSLCLVFLGLQMVMTSAVAQEPPAEEKSYQPSTAVDAAIPVDHLQVMLRPLMQDELEAEAQSWIDLLRTKIREVGDTELSIKDLAEGESSDALAKQLVLLRTEETDLVERTRLVLDALKSKGGDVEDSQQFIDSVSDLSETTDKASYRAALVAEIRNWASRDDGGKLLAKRMLVAAVILLVFWIMSKFAGRVTAKVLSRHPRASSLLENFARRTAGAIVFVVGVLMALSVLGFEIGPMMAALGAGGFIVGFALQETLGSFASGLMIMVYRPFDVDDYVSVAGFEGTVQEMSLVSTTLRTFDNKLLVIPNKKAWSETVTNYTSKDLRRIDLIFGIAYDDDIRHSIDVLKKVAGDHPLVLEEPAVSVDVSELADSSVNLFCRPWVKTEDYWPVRADLTRQVKERFDSEGISFPFPQRDIHLDSATSPSDQQASTSYPSK